MKAAYEQKAANTKRRAQAQRKGREILLGIFEMGKQSSYGEIFEVAIMTLEEYRYKHPDEFREVVGAARAHAVS